jgi:hypothetical protein
LFPLLIQAFYPIFIQSFIGLFVGHAAGMGARGATVMFIF